MKKFFELLENYEDNDELIKQIIVVKCELQDKQVEDILKDINNTDNECVKDVYFNYFSRVYQEDIQNNSVEVSQENIVIQEEKGGGSSYMLVFIGLILILFYIYQK